MPPIAEFGILKTGAKDQHTAIAVKGWGRNVPPTLNKSWEQQNNIENFILCTSIWQCVTTGHQIILSLSIKRGIRFTTIVTYSTTISFTRTQFTPAVYEVFN